MSRYIDADALIEACEQWKESVEHDAQDVAWNHGIDACINEIKHHAPTVNAVEVVRCKYCKWWTKQKNSLQGRCALTQSYPTGAWYCANGERKDGEEE